MDDTLTLAATPASQRRAALNFGLAILAMLAFAGDARALTACVNVTATPSPAAFGGQSINTKSLPLTVKLTNQGGGLCFETVRSVVVTPTAGFSVSRNTCTTNLAVGQFCELDVDFTPAAVGAATGNLKIDYTYISILTFSGTLNVALSGTGEKSLVTHYYGAILNRAPDAAGKSYWESEAARLTSLGIDINETWYVMAGYFFNSPEYISYGKTDAQFLTDVYNTFFNRPPDPSGIKYWSDQLALGMPREVVLFSFMFSPEFRTFTTAIFGNTASRPEVNMVVDFFRGLLNRLPDTPSFNYWLAQLKAAQCTSPGAVYGAVESISYNFMFSPEYGNRARNNTQFVTDMYYSFLRRGGDLAGVNFWINELQTTARTANRVRQDFIASPEFGARVQAVIAAGCVP